jgi:F-type H+-transporting ATPase subunit O
MEDTITGRYAHVLFISASTEECLYSMYEDMRFLSEMFQNSEELAYFVTNQGVGAKEVAVFNEGLAEAGDFQDLTFRFIQVLAENKRLMFIEDIANKFCQLYRSFHKEEKITIISAETLDNSQQADVLAALQANPQN